MYNASKYSTRLAIAIMYWAATVTEELEQINSHYLSNTCMYTDEFRAKLLRTCMRTESQSCDKE